MKGVRRVQNVGIVLELEANHAIVMRKDGHFVRIPRTSEMGVGMEVGWEPVTRTVPTQSAVQPLRLRRKSTLRGWRIGAAGIAACLAVSAGLSFGMGVFSPTQAEAYAFVSLDINPSVSIQVDKKLVVIDATGMNADGVSLLQHLKLKGEPLQKAISNVVNAALQDHMIPQNDTILISTAPNTAGVNVAQVQQQAESSVKAAIQANPLTQSLHPSVFALGLSSTMWKAADTAHLSPGKLAAYLMAAKEGVHVTDVTQLTGATLEQVLSATDADDASQILRMNDPKQVGQLIHDLQTSGMLVADGDGNDSPILPAGQEAPGTKSDKGHPQQAPGKTSKPHATPGGGVIVHLGGSTLTVPVGGANPVSTGSITGKGDSHGHGGNQGQSNRSEGNKDSSARDDGAGGHDGNATGYGDGRDHAKHGHDGADSNGSGDNSSLNEVLQNLH